MTTPDTEPTNQQEMPEDQFALIEKTVLEMVVERGGVESFDPSDKPTTLQIFESRFDELAPYTLGLLERRYIDEIGDKEVPEWVSSMYSRLSTSVDKFEGNRPSPLEIPLEV